MSASDDRFGPRQFNRFLCSACKLSVRFSKQHDAMHVAWCRRCRADTNWQLDGDDPVVAKPA